MEPETLDTITVDRAKLVSDLRVVLSDAEQLFKQAASATGDQAKELRERAQDALHRAQRGLGDLQASASDAMRKRARATDDWVRDHPWTAVGVASCIGLLVGLLAGRR
jgi:ElaB/YqjD/DUF883 family membrane-anchored ribosome-binding protein